MNRVMGWARTGDSEPSSEDCVDSRCALVGPRVSEHSVASQEEAEETSIRASGESTQVESSGPVPRKECPRTSFTDVSTQTERHTLELEAESLALAIVRNRLGLVPPPDGRVGACLHRCVSELLQRHSILFTGMVRRLAPQPDTAYATFRGVAQELFAAGAEGGVDGGVGGVTWGRLVALYAFAARLAMYCSEQRQLRHLREEPAYFLAHYVGEAAIPFLQANGGWEGLCQHFPAPDDLENRIWRTLLVAGLGLGLAATFLATHS